jgi:hypothetical protein
MSESENIMEILKKNKQLPIYLRYSKIVEQNGSSLTCVLKSNTYQTNLYNRKKNYKPILLENVDL